MEHTSSVNSEKTALQRQKYKDTCDCWWNIEFCLCETIFIAQCWVRTCNWPVVTLYCMNTWAYQFAK